MTTMTENDEQVEEVDIDPQRAYRLALLAITLTAPLSMVTKIRTEQPEAE
jgi:hypothetical protein